MLSSPRRLALSWRAVRRCSVRCLIRSVRSAIWTSGEPVSLSSRRYAVITSFLLGSVADGTRCPFLILWISYSLTSLPDGARSAEGSEPRQERGGLFGAFAWIHRGHGLPARADHDQQLAEARLDRRIRLREGRVGAVQRHVDGASQRSRLAADLQAGLVEVAESRDGLLEAPRVRVPHVGVARGEAQHALAL